MWYFKSKLRPLYCQINIMLRSANQAHWAFCWYIQMILKTKIGFYLNIHQFNCCLKEIKDSFLLERIYSVLFFFRYVSAITSFRSLLVIVNNFICNYCGTCNNFPNVLFIRYITKMNKGNSNDVSLLATNADLGRLDSISVYRSLANSHPGKTEDAHTRYQER